MPPFFGSLKKAKRSTLQWAVSSVTGKWKNGASLLAFFMDMKISFSCVSGEAAGLGGARQVGRAEPCPWAAAA